MGVIHEKFYAATRLPRAVSYKQNTIRPEGAVFLATDGKRSECQAEFAGTIFNEPKLDLDPYVMMERRHLIAERNEPEEGSDAGREHISLGTLPYHKLPD